MSEDTPSMSVGRKLGRYYPRKTQTSGILRLRACVRISAEIDRRKRAGRFTAKDLSALLADNSPRQAEGDMSAIVAHRWSDVGFERLCQIIEALGLDADTIFLPIEQSTRKAPVRAVEQVAA